jgi:hypothetical protein
VIGDDEAAAIAGGGSDARRSTARVRVDARRGGRPGTARRGRCGCAAGGGAAGRRRCRPTWRRCCRPGGGSMTDDVSLLPGLGWRTLRPGVTRLWRTPRVVRRSRCEGTCPEGSRWDQAGPGDMREGTDERAAGWRASWWPVELLHALPGALLVRAGDGTVGWVRGLLTAGRAPRGGASGGGGRRARRCGGWRCEPARASRGAVPARGDDEAAHRLFGAGAAVRARGAGAGVAAALDGPGRRRGGRGGRWASREISCSWPASGRGGHVGVVLRGIGRGRADAGARVDEPRAR